MKRVLLVIFSTFFFVLTACGSQEEIQLTEEPLPQVQETQGSEPEPKDLPEPVAYGPATNFLANIRSGGVPPDGIPSIDTPEFISVEEAGKFHQGDSQMFLVELEGQVYFYPQSIMVWHEIVNMPHMDVAVTYCPLTGSAITYEHPEGLITSFGTSGSLLNSNLVMYDRTEDVLISQIDGVGLEGDLEGYGLKSIPTYWIDFQTASENYPDALVLSSNTGYIRNYNNDPYGSYTEDKARNYYADQGVMFPLMHVDNESMFHDKHMVIGIKAGQNRIALDPSAVSQGQVLPIGDGSLSAVYDSNLKAVRIYNHDNPLELVEGVLQDSSGSQWQIDGKPMFDGEPLTSPIYYEVMWFAWHAFYPDTEVIQ